MAEKTKKTGSLEDTVESKENTASSTVSTPKEETVTLKRSEFEMMMASIEKLSKDQETLFKVADKNRLAKINDIGQGLIKQVKISRWKENDLYIIGWKLVKNISEILPGSNRWVEEQIVAVIFEDNNSIEVPLLDFYRRCEKDVADIKGQTSRTDEKNNTIVVFEVVFPNGKQLAIDSRFVN